MKSSRLKLSVELCFCLSSMNQFTDVALVVIPIRPYFETAYGANQLLFNAAVQFRITVG